MSPSPRLGVPWVTLRDFPWLSKALVPMMLTSLENPLVPLDAAAGWGQKFSARYAAFLARQRGLPMWFLEDGFYRSVGLGKSRAESFSLVLDRRGLFFDCHGVSDLEAMLAADIDDEVASHGRALREFIVSRRLSKYNHLPDTPIRLEAPKGARRILLVDQVAGDRSLHGAGAGPQSFTTMAQMAADRSQTGTYGSQTGGAILFAKAHPDVVAGFGQGMLAGALGNLKVQWVPADAAPHAILDEIDEVWTVSSQLGFDALLRGKTVTCFAAPFYAGWGLTQDCPSPDGPAEAALRRRAGRTLTLDQLCGVALGRYPIYFDPVRQRPTTPEQALERLAAWRDQWLGHRGRVLAIGFAWHKRRLIRAHLGSAGAYAKFLRHAPKTIDFQQFDEIASWSDRVSASTMNAAGAAGLRTSIFEDGFIRSRGLGAWNNLPNSLCVDTKAAHFDASMASELEDMLQERTFTPAQLARAAALRGAIVQNNVSKYNLANGPLPDIRALAQGRKVILVLAQVPGDASLRHGQPLHGSNLDFIRQVRQQDAGCFLVFKEHPDLVAGIKPGLTPAQELTKVVDLVLANGDVTPVYELVDEVHVMTSLAGFEALLRGGKVVCHGLPFYAGWGLTQDLVACARRTQTISLDALVAAALISYPKYLLHRTLQPCEVEDVLKQIG